MQRCGETHVGRRQKTKQKNEHQDRLIYAGVTKIFFIVFIDVIDCEPSVFFPPLCFVFRKERMLRGGAKACRSVTLGDSFVCAAHNCQCRQYSSTFASFPGSQQSTSARRRVLDRVVIPRTTAVPNHLAATVAKQQSSVTATTMTKRTSSSSPPHSSLSLPSSSVRRSGLVKNVLSASPRDLDILVRRCAAAAAATNPSSSLLSSSATRPQWEEAVLLLQGALHLSMVPTRLTYRSVLELVAIHCTSLPSIRRILDGMSASHRSAALLSRYLLRYLARHQPRSALEFLLEVQGSAKEHTDYSSATMRLRQVSHPSSVGASFDVAAVSEALHRLSQSTAPAAPSAKSDTAELMLSILPYLEARRCPPQTEMIEALLWACSHISTSTSNNTDHAKGVWQVAMGLLHSVVALGSPNKSVADTSAPPPSLAITSSMSVDFLRTLGGPQGGGQWASAVEFVIRHCKRDVLRDAHVQMAIAVALISSTLPPSSPHHSGTVVSGGIHNNNWQRALSIADRVVAQTPLYSGEDRWSVVRHVIPMIPSWRAALEYLRRSAVGSVYDDESGAAASDHNDASDTAVLPSTSNTATSSPLSHRDWIEAKAALVPRLPVSCIESRRFVLGWMKSDPRIAAARLLADAAAAERLDGAREEKAEAQLRSGLLPLSPTSNVLPSTPLLWSDALEAASASLRSTSIPTTEGAHQRLLVAAVFYDELRRNEFLSSSSTGWTGDSSALACVNVNGQVQHAILHMDGAALKDLLRLVMPPPGSLKRGLPPGRARFWEGALRLFTSATSTTPSIVSGMQVLMQWQAEEVGDWASALSICAHIPVPSARRCSALEQLMSTKQLWMQALAYSSLCDASQEEGGGGGRKFVVTRTYGAPLCGSVGKYHAVRDVLRSIGVESDADRFLLDKAELGHEEALIRSDFEASLHNSTLLPSSQFWETGAHQHHQHNERPFLIHAQRNPVIPLSLALLATSGWTLVLKHALVCSRRRSSTCHERHAEHSFLLEELNVLLSFAAVRFPAVSKHMWPYSLKALHAWWWGASRNGPVVLAEDESISNVATWRQSFVRELPHLCSDKGDIDVWFLAAAIGGTWTRLSCEPRHEGEGNAAPLEQHLLSVDIAATLVDSLIATFSTTSTHHLVPPVAAPTTTQTEVALEDMTNPLVIFTVRNAMALLLDVTLAPLLVGASTASSLPSSVDVVLHWGLQQHARPQVSRPSSSGAGTDADPRPLLSVGSYVDRSLVARSQLRDDDDATTTTTGHKGNQRGACSPPSQGAVIGVAAVEYLVGVCGCIPHADSLEGIAMSLDRGESLGKSVNLISQDDLRARAEWTSLWKRLMRCLTNPQAIAASAPYAALTRGAVRCASLGEWANALRLFRQSFSVAPEAAQVSDSLIHVRELQRRMSEEETAGLLRRCEDATTTQHNDANGLVAACLSLGPRRWSAALQLMSTFVGSPASPSPPHKDVDHGQPPTTSAISTPISTALMRHIVTSCASSTRDANVVLKVMHLLHHTYLFVPQREDLSSVLEAAFAASLSVGTDGIGADAALLHVALLLVTCLQRYFAAAAPTARELHVLLELCPWASSSGLRDALAVLSELRDVLQGAQLVDAMEAMLDLQDDHQRHALGDTVNYTGHTADAKVVSSPPAAQWMARGLAAFHEARRAGARTSESAMDKRSGRWTTQRLRMVAQFVPELLSAEASDHAAASSNHVQRVAHTISDTVLNGTVPADAVVEAWQSPAMRERLLRTHFSKQDGEDAKNSLSVVAGGSPAIAGGTATINPTTTTLHPSESVISFAATYGPWIRFGSTTLVNKRAVAELGRDVAEAWPVHRLRTVLNVHRKHIARLQHRASTSERKKRDYQGQPHDDDKNKLPFDPWVEAEFVEDFLTSVPLLVRLLPFIHHGAVGSEGDMVRRETMEAVCSSVLHYLVPLRTLEKYWEELMTHAELLEERRWPSDAEGELVLAMTVSPSASNPADRKSMGVCPTRLSALPSATPEEIRHYWAMYHPVLNPGTSFHTKELRYIATHYYPLLQSAAAASSSSATMLADVCREIASEVFPLTAVNADGSSSARLDPTFQYHTAEDVQQLWRTSKTTLQDLWRTSPSSTIARVVHEERPHRREVTGAAEARHSPSSSMREVSGKVERQPSQSTSVRSSRTPIIVTEATTPSFQNDAACPPLAAVQSDVSSNSVVAVRSPSTNLQRHRRRAVASVGSGLRWRVALSLLKWSLSSLPPPTDSHHHGSPNMSHHELAHHLVPVVQLCMLDCNTPVEEARNRIETSLGPVGDECWATVCRHIVGSNKHTAVESESSAAVRDALAQHRESFPSVVLAALERVLVNTTTSSGVEGEALLRVITNVALNKSQENTLKVLVEQWWPVNDSGEARQGVLTLLKQPR